MKQSLRSRRKEPRNRIFKLINSIVSHHREIFAFVLQIWHLYFYFDFSCPGCSCASTLFYYYEDASETVNCVNRLER